MDHSSLLLFIVPYAIGALFPGPVQIALVTRVITQGHKGAFPFVLGIVTGNSCWLCVTVLGLSTIAMKYAALFVFIKWFGILYLIVLSWKLWFAPIGEMPISGLINGLPRISLFRGFVGGAALTMGNPKAMLFFGAILPQVFDLSSITFPGFILIFTIGVSIDALSQFLYVFSAARARRFIQSLRHQRMINRIAGSLMFGAATVIAVRR
jgi:threonine/homoserine/homoserine lactone efflux protein